MASGECRCCRRLLARDPLLEASDLQCAAHQRGVASEGRLGSYENAVELTFLLFQVIVDNMVEEAVRMLSQGGNLVKQARL